MSGPFDAVLLTGGRARRLQGAEKPSLKVGGEPMARRAAAAVGAADRVVVVGPACGVEEAAAVVREEPPGGGPVAAVAAGLACTRAPEVVVLAADLPFVTAGHVAALREALAAEPAAAVAFPVDEGGRDQALFSVWRAAELAAALAALGSLSGSSVRALVAAAGPVVRVEGLGTEGGPPPWFDCDTPGDLARARRWAGRGTT